MKEIKLSQNKVALVDDEDFEKLSKFVWVAAAKKDKYYAVTYTGGRSNRYMHRWLLNPPKPLEVDHINGDSLDNRKCNLRVCTSLQNKQNMRVTRGKFGYKGVYYRDKNPPNKRWCAYININGRRNHIGSFETAEIAARAYDSYAIDNFGKFAFLNFKREGYDGLKDSL